MEKQQDFLSIAAAGKWNICSFSRDRYGVLHEIEEKDTAGFYLVQVNRD
jgi:hypothetical protein